MMALMNRKNMAWFLAGDSPALGRMAKIELESAIVGDNRLLLKIDLMPCSTALPADACHLYGLFLIPFVCAATVQAYWAAAKQGIRPGTGLRQRIAKTFNSIRSGRKVR